MNSVIVVGGGPAGMMAAGTAGRRGREVILVEKNPVLGRKLRITGKGRCNLTNATHIQLFLEQIIKNAPFLYSSLHRFSNQDLVDFFHELGLPTKVQRGERVFPVSERAIDVVNTLETFLHASGVQVMQGRVSAVKTASGAVKGVILQGGGHLEAYAVVLATGGLSYPATGSTGDGYGMASALGHRITPLSPSLVPIQVKEDWVSTLHGLKLKNVSLQLVDGAGEIRYQGLGEVHFYNQSLSGPLALTASAVVGEVQGEGYQAILDVKPALSSSKLDQRLQRDFMQYRNRDFSNALKDLLPRRLQELFILRSGIPPEKKVHQVTREERQRLVNLLKNFTLSLTALAPFTEAVVTSGGISVKEIHPSTMESKRVSGLYFAGEILDVHGLTGGFNLQLAFSTGFVAGSSL